MKICKTIRSVPLPRIVFLLSLHRKIFFPFVFYSVFIVTRSSEKPWVPSLVQSLADYGLWANPTVKVSLTDLLCLSTSRWNKVQMSPLNPIKQWRWQVSPAPDSELGFFLPISPMEASSHRTRKQGHFLSENQPRASLCGIWRSFFGELARPGEQLLLGALMNRRQ